MISNEQNMRSDAANRYTELSDPTIHIVFMPIFNAVIFQGCVTYRIHMKQMHRCIFNPEPLEHRYIVHGMDKCMRYRIAVLHRIQQPWPPDLDEL